MPITEYGVEYSIPENIKKLITPKFCKQFIKELHMIWGTSLEDFDYDSLAYCESTSGWYESFVTTCRKLGSDELFKYYCLLPWYDSDIFDGELTSILVKNKLILPTSEVDEIARQLGIDSKEIVVCDKCGKCFLKTDISEQKEEETEETESFGFYESEYICHNCTNTKEVTPLTCNIKKAIHEILEKTETDYFICEKCGKIHSNNHKGKKYCLHCEQEIVPDTNVNYYYRRNLQENYKYHDSLIPVHMEYEGYQTDVSYSYEDKVWYGSIKPIENPEEFKDLVSFHSYTKDLVKKEFHEAVKDYLEFKKEIQKS